MRCMCAVREEQMPCEYLYRSQFANCHAYTKCKHLRFAALSHSLCGSLNRSDIDAYCNLICSGMHCFCSFLVRPFSCVADLRALPSASRFFFFSLIYFICAMRSESAAQICAAFSFKPYFAKQSSRGSVEWKKRKSPAPSHPHASEQCIRTDIHTLEPK